MKFLGIDYGVRRVGIAISDHNGVLAFPSEILENDEDFFKKLSDILAKENVDEIVVGESMNFQGQANKIETAIKIFVKKLEEKFKLPVHRQKEFLTSVEARKSGNTKKDSNLSQAHSKIKKIKLSKVDNFAAALILQRYLDKINNS